MQIYGTFKGNGRRARARRARNPQYGVDVGCPRGRPRYRRHVTWLGSAPGAPCTPRPLHSRLREARNVGQSHEDRATDMAPRLRLCRDLAVQLDFLEHQIGAHMSNARQTEKELLKKNIIVILVPADDT